MNEISKYTAIIPAAGLGTRLLPATKAIPKELLPIVDTPAIQLIVEEIVSSGIDDIVFITARGKESIIDYFDSAPQLEATLKSRGQDKFLAKITKPANMANYVSVRQNRPLGLGHAILMAEPVARGDNVAVLLPDDLIDSQVPCLKQMISVRESQEAAVVVALMEVESKDVSRYGIVSGELTSERVYSISGMVEKPTLENAPSSYAVIGRYLFSSDLFEYIKNTKKGKGGEIQLTDAISAMIKDGKKVIGYLFEGKRFDTGNVVGYLEANISHALKDPELAGELKQKLKLLLDE
jgi:UTP--glucose-1-phosphate uridylyltransferase